MQRHKILVVDDEQEICLITKDFLSRKNYLVFTAFDDDKAMEVVEKEHPDLVVLDLRLEKASGLDVLAKIKQFDQKIKVIMVTGLSDDESREKAKSLGADDFLTKPFTANYLSDLIAKRLTVK